MRKNLAAGMAAAVAAVLMTGCSASVAGTSPAASSVPPSDADANQVPPTAWAAPGDVRLTVAVDGWTHSPMVPDKLTWPRTSGVLSRVYVMHPTEPAAVTINTFAEVDGHGIPEERTQRSFACATDTSGDTRSLCRLQKEKPGVWAIDLDKRTAGRYRFGVLNAEWTSAGDTRFMTWQLP